MKLSPFLLMLSFLAAAMIVYFYNPVHKTINYNGCFSTDNGFNPQEKGTTYASNGVFEDYCTNTGNLVEYFCNPEGTAGYAQIYCGGKCINGACLGYLRCKFNQPINRTIIIRMDDVQANMWDSAVINLTNTVLSRNMSISLGVIPGHIDQDQTIVSFISSKLDDTKISIVQHGTYHTYREFGNLSENETYYLAKAGLEELKRVFNIQPITFDPPNGAYNNNTDAALSLLGFKVITAGENTYYFDGEMLIIGYNGIARYSHESELTPVSTVINGCNNALNTHNVCLVLFHPQDYLNQNGGLINETKYKSFVQLLDGLEKLNANFSNFRQMLAC